MRAALLALPFWLAACAASPPPEPPSPAGPAAAPSASSTAPPPAAERPPAGRVGAVDASKDAVMSLRVKIVFENPTKKPCRITGYRLTVGAWKKDVTLDGFDLPPGETRERWLRVNPEDRAPLDPPLVSGQVDLKADCGR